MENLINGLAKVIKIAVGSFLLVIFGLIVAFLGTIYLLTQMAT